MNPEDANYKKSLLFKIVIIIIAVTVFVLWIANLQNVFESKTNQDNDSLTNITNTINKSLKEAEDSFNKLTNTSSTTEKIFVEELIDKASGTAAVVSTTTATSEIKKELLDLVKDATTTATTTLKTNNCPAYINCMPTIGESKPCIVPAGCEKITQIAY